MFFILIVKSRNVWAQKKNVPFAVKNWICSTTQWKNGKSKDLFAETVIQKNSTSIILENMLELTKKNNFNQF